MKKLLLTLFVVATVGITAQDTTKVEDSTYTHYYSYPMEMEEIEKKKDKKEKKDKKKVDLGLDRLARRSGTYLLSKLIIW